MCIIDIVLIFLTLSILSSLIGLSCSALVSATGFQEKYGDDASNAACKLVTALYEGKKEKNSSEESSSNLFSNLGNVGNDLFKSIKEFFPLTNKDGSDSSKDSFSNLFSTIGSLGGSILQSASDIFSSSSSAKPDAGENSSLDFSKLKELIKEVSEKIGSLDGKIENLSDILEKYGLKTSDNENQKILKKLAKKYNEELEKLRKQSEKLNLTLKNLISETSISERNKKNKKYKKEANKYLEGFKEVNILGRLISELS